MSLKAQVSFKIPGKTFLLGEYLALYGGPSLVLTTSPFFEIIARPGTGKHPFHPESPTGKYIQYHQEFFASCDLEFNDPYGSGGFGASTAQFIAVAVLFRYGDELAQEHFFTTRRHDVALKVWDIYRDMFWSTELKPSGADLVAQMAGEICMFDGEGKKHEVLSWPFAGKDILLFKTPNKIATHEHLADLKLEPKILKKELLPMVKQAIDALKTANWVTWVQAQENFAKSLSRMQLVHPDTELLLQKIAKIPGVLSARGCGALGADVIAVTIESNQQNAITAQLQDLKLMASLSKNQSYGPIIEVKNLEGGH